MACLILHGVDPSNFYGFIAFKSLKSVGRKYEYKNVSYIETKPTFWTKMSIECILFVEETHTNAQDNAISFQFQHRVFGVKMVPVFAM